MKQVGIVGCGQMGGGIAQVCAQSGYEVIASEVNEELLNKGLASINSRLTRAVEKETIKPEDKEAIFSRLRGTTNLKDFSRCDLVIEAAIENIELKKKIFAELDAVCPKHTILATNTSCLSIIEMAMTTKRPDKVLGLHFFNPPPMMKLLEVVRTVATSEETLEIGREFGQSLGKTPIIAPDSPGFIVNRLLVPQILHAIAMLESGVATREDIDNGMTLGLNHPIGPLALADLIGLDTMYFIAIAMYDDFKEPQFAPPTLLKKMVTAGWLGRKTGKGFHEYK
ncbi:MAG: 3-hydroxybutyryl-CoA dehydrogenase [Dehalococcoidia bacterium SG8_51_3]|nr:MAG: 3-hydroxybutyryl-CoA dehydrogenase [Dehalococcoidia bacterium SG8_51_3]